MPITGGLQWYWKKDRHKIRYQEFGIKDAQFGHYTGKLIEYFLQQARTLPLNPLEIHRLYVVCSGDINEEREDETDYERTLTYRDALEKNWSRETLDGKIQDLKIHNRQRWLEQL